MEKRVLVLGVGKVGKSSVHDVVTFLKSQAGKLSAAAFLGSRRWAHLAAFDWQAKSNFSAIGCPAWLEPAVLMVRGLRLQLHNTITPSPSGAWVMSLQGPVSCNCK